NTSTSSPVTVGGLAVIGLAPTGPVSQLSSVIITFNTGVQTFPLTATGVTLTDPLGRPVPLADAGGNPLPGVTLTDTNPANDTVWELDFPTNTTPGVYKLPVGPDVTDTTGTKMDQNQNHSAGDFGPLGDQFVGFLTVGGLGVVSVTPTETLDINGLSSVLVTFNSSVQSFPTSAVGLKDPSGNPIPLTASQNPSVSLVHLTDKNPGIDTIWQVDLPTQVTPGTYTLTIGPNVTDRAGDQMAQAFQQPLKVDGLSVVSAD